jgi:predicted naringenin-chalcone synthase
MDNAGQYFLRRLTVTAGAHSYSQASMAENLRAKIADLPNAKSVLQTAGFIYEHSSIKNRHFEFDLEEIEKRSDWYRLVNETTLSMATRVLTKLFAEQITAAECDGLVVVTSAYGGFPALSRHLQSRLGFPLEALCFDLTGLGCNGSTHGIQLAQMLLERGDCNTVCVICADSMGTHAQSRKHTRVPTMSEVVAHCLSSDGAAALILSNKPGKQPIFSYRTCALASKMWPDSLHLNVQSASEQNQPFIVVGKEIQTRIGDEFAYYVNKNAAILEEPALFHPGGIALMKLLREKYPQLAETTELSIGELQETGNFGSPSVLWVLNAALRKNVKLTPRVRLITFGPGKVTAILLIDGIEMNL